MKHEYLVQTKPKGAEVKGLHTVSMNEDKLQGIIGSPLMYKLNNCLLYTSPSPRD